MKKRTLSVFIVLSLILFAFITQTTIYSFLTPFSNKPFIGFGLLEILASIFFTIILLLFWNYLIENSKHRSEIRKLTFVLSLILISTNIFIDVMDWWLVKQIIFIPIIALSVIIGLIVTQPYSFFNRFITGITIGFYSAFFYSISIIFIDTYVNFDGEINEFLNAFLGRIGTQITHICINMNLFIIASFLIAIFSKPFLVNDSHEILDNDF